MTYSVIIAAPLLIAAIVMAVRFVGCTEDFDQFDPHGDNGETKGGKNQAMARLSGLGTLSAEPAFAAHDPEPPVQFTPQGAYSYDIPWWCNFIDLFLLGGGGGGVAGNGGQGGSWKTVTLWRGPGQPPPGVVQIPAATTSISITVGSGGSGGSIAAAPNPGGETTATAVGMPPQTAPGGAAGANSDVTGTGPSPATETLSTTTETAGADQTTPGGPGNPPGGGGAGDGFFGGGAGADGQAWAVARQT